jgi:C4-type Zn-finger protein
MFGFSTSRLPFRRSYTDIMIGVFNISIAVGVGFISGQYIFREPLEQYWAEKNRQHAAFESQNTVVSSTITTTENGKSKTTVIPSMTDTAGKSTINASNAQQQQQQQEK